MGVIVNLAQGQVLFQPLAVLGGVFWATGGRCTCVDLTHEGNLTVVPAVKAIGLAQGMLIWGTMNMIMGWAAARFGNNARISNEHKTLVIPIITVFDGFCFCFFFFYFLYEPGRFGWFGIVPEVPSNTTLQYLGVVCAVVSVLMYALVKTDIRPVSGTKEEQRSLLKAPISTNGEVTLSDTCLGTKINFYEF